MALKGKFQQSPKRRIRRLSAKMPALVPIIDEWEKLVIQKFLKSASGAAAVEYGLTAVLFAVAFIAALDAFVSS